MRSYQIFFLLIFISCTPSVFRQDLLRNYGIRYKPCDSITNATAYCKLNEVFSNNNPKTHLFDSAAGCFPLFWSEIKGNSYFANADGAPLCLGLGNNKVIVGKIIRHNRFLDSLQSYIVGSVKNDTPFVIRKLNDDELSTYWSMIGWDIEEPIFILVSKFRKLIFNFNKEYVWVFEDISNTHYVSPVPMESIINQLPDFKNKSK